MVAFIEVVIAGLLAFPLAWQQVLDRILASICTD
jgi:hypothetical protein